MDKKYEYPDSWKEGEDGTEKKLCDELDDLKERKIKGFGKPKSLFINKSDYKMAIRASDFTQHTLKMGASNKKGDLIEGGREISILDSSANFRLINTVMGKHIDIVANAIKAISIQTGNCDEHAVVVYCYLIYRNIENVELWQQDSIAGDDSTFDHSFVVIRDKTQMDKKVHGIVCDPWNNTVGVILNSRTSTKGKKHYDLWVSDWRGGDGIDWDEEGGNPNYIHCHPMEDKADKEDLNIETKLIEIQKSIKESLGLGSILNSFNVLEEISLNEDSTKKLYKKKDMLYGEYEDLANTKVAYGKRKERSGSISSMGSFDDPYKMFEGLTKDKFSILEEIEEVEEEIDEIGEVDLNIERVNNIKKRKVTSKKTINILDQIKYKRQKLKEEASNIFTGKKTQRPIRKKET